MSESLENYEFVAEYWFDSSDRNLVTMNNLFKIGDNSWALFMGHLVLEKLLKGIYVKKFRAHPIYTHDLLRLTERIGLEADSEKKSWLDQITAFNINARYESYKYEFYKICTLEYTENWITKINLLRQWLKENS